VPEKLNKLMTTYVLQVQLCLIVCGTQDMICMFLDSSVLKLVGLRNARMRNASIKMWDSTPTLKYKFNLGLIQLI